MSSTTTRKGKQQTQSNNGKAEVHPLQQQHSEKILAWQGAQAEVQRIIAQEQESGATEQTKKAKLSAGARKANRKHEIRELELDMRAERVPFEKWEEPASPKRRRARNNSPVPTQEQMQSNLERMFAIYSNADEDPGMVHTADLRISALLRDAQRHGYQLTDPRQAS